MSYLRKVPIDWVRLPLVNAPTLVIQDNAYFYAFTVDTDYVLATLEIPFEYITGGMDFSFIWTVPGATSQLNRNVRWRLSFQIAGIGDQASGNHPLSPLEIEDTYTSTGSWVLHQTPWAKIPHAAVMNKACIHAIIGAVTPIGPALTEEPHLVGMCFRNKAIVPHPRSAF